MNSDIVVSKLDKSFNVLVMATSKQCSLKASQRYMPKALPKLGSETPVDRASSRHSVFCEMLG
jgi:hypothetical protein